MQALVSGGTCAVWVAVRGSPLEEDLLDLVVVAGDAREQGFDGGGVGYAATLLHRLGELGMDG
jgi:hypothetical protein